MSNEMDSGSTTELALESGETPRETNTLFDDSDIPQEFMEQALKNDPELRQYKNDKEAAKAAKSKKKQPPSHPAPKEEIGNAEKAVDSEKEILPEKVEKIDEETSSTNEPDFESLEFKDDVIPGIKGETLKKIGPEAAEALASYHEKHQEINEKYTKTNSRLETLLRDPVIKHREEMIRAGKTEYPVRGITDVEKQQAIEYIAKLQQEKLDLTPEEATHAASLAFNTLIPFFEKVSKDSAEDVIKNLLLEENSKRENKETATKARSIFLKMGKYNKDLTFNETNPDNFWKEGTDESGNTVNILNLEHPEIEKFKKYTLPVMEALVKAGIKYPQLLKMAEEFGEDAVYSFAAKKLGLPVAINTEDRDRKMLNSGIKTALKPFIKGSASEELKTEGGKTVAGTKNKGTDGGIDIQRLLDDENYYDSVIRQKPGDEKWVDHIAELTDKALRERNKKRK
jgi:hypothetical protein